jgi:F-type H+-transporting ATPase subunit delta
MAEKSTIARPYAQAAFSLAESAGDLKKWSEMLQLISTVASDEVMQNFIGNPNVERTELTDIILDVCGKNLDELGQNFVRVLAENKRLDVTAEIAKLYEAKRAEAEKTIEAEVTSAFPLSDAIKDKIIVSLKQKLGREVKLITRTDENMIGGAVIRAGDLVIDASVTGQLEQLAYSLSH